MFKKNYKTSCKSILFCTTSKPSMAETDDLVIPKGTVTTANVMMCIILDDLLL